MKFLSTVTALATVNLSAFASPVGEMGTSIVEQRASFVTCKPINFSTNKVDPQKVDLATAASEARRAGLVPGLSGDPHRFMNGEGIKWGVRNCDLNGAILFEFPVYKVGIKKTWQKDAKTKGQTPTDIRTVYANVNGGIVFCGVMTHNKINIPIEKQGKNAPPFIHCT